MSRGDVLLVAQQLRGTRSGVGTYVRSLLEELVRREAAPAVATWSEELDPESFPDVRFVDLGTRPRTDPTPGGFVALGRRLAERLPGQDARPALLHFTDAREAHGYLTRTAVSERLPIVGTIHDDYAASAPASPFGLVGQASDPYVRWAYYRWLARVERRTYPAMSFWMVNSRATGESVTRRYGLDAARVRLVHLCLPPAVDAPDEAMVLDGAPAVLFAGGNFYRKGLHTLVESLPLLRRAAPDAVVHVAGHDPSERRIGRLAERLGVASAVRFLGRVPRERMGAMMAAADAFAMPSRTEALGLVYLEAMRAGTPVVSGNVGGVTEIVRDGASGLSVPPGDPGALAAALLRLHGDADLRARLVDGGRAVLAERTPARLADETVAVYAEALAG